MLPVALVLGVGALFLAFAGSEKKKQQQQGQPFPQQPLPGNGQGQQLPGWPQIPQGAPQIPQPGQPTGGTQQPQQPGAPGFPPMTLPPELGGVLGGILGGAKPAGTQPGQAGAAGEWWMPSTKDPNVLVCRPGETQANLMLMLNQKSIAAATQADLPYPPGAQKLLDTPPVLPQQGALAYVVDQSHTKGRITVMALTRPIIASIAPGEEKLYCSAAAKQFAVIADGNEIQPVPQQGGTTQPGQTTPTQGQGTGDTQPAIYGIPVPPVPGLPTTVPSTPPQGSANGIEIPGIGTIPIPGQPPPAGAGPSTTLGPTDRAGQWPVSHIHVVGAGVNPTDVAAHYTGSIQRAFEIQDLNHLQGKDKDMKDVPPHSSSTYFMTPWFGGNRMALPKDWDMSKGPPKPKYGTAKSAKAPNVKKPDPAAKPGQTKA